jgi:hypothetical protein
MPCRALIGKGNKAIAGSNIKALSVKNCKYLNILYSNYAIPEDYGGMPAAESGNGHGW